MKIKNTICLLFAFLSYPLFSQVYEGYTLFNPQNSKVCKLINMDGSLLHSWTCSANPGLTSYLLPDSTLVRAQSYGSGVSGATGIGGQIQKIGWTGNVLWSFIYSGADYIQHHDICPMPNGNVLLISCDRKTSAEATAAGCLSVNGNYVLSEKIVEVEPSGTTTGNIVWEWRLWDHLIQNVDSTKPNYGVISEHPERMNINFGKVGVDWIHMNAVDYNPQLDQIIFSAHELSEICIIDHSTTTAEAATSSGGNAGKGGDFLYRWGNPQSYGRGNSSSQYLYVVHGANWVDSGLPGAGNIIAFNNGDRAGTSNDYSNIVEIVPPLEGYNYHISPDSAYGPTTPVWSYSASGFYSQHLGGVQRLPNGNTLVCEAMDNGKLWEVTSSGTIVWSYTIGAENTRAYRYGLDYFNGVEENKIDLSKKYVLKQNYPNPFNSFTKINYSIPVTSKVSLKIYDIQGRLLKTLVDNEIRQGNYSVELSAEKLTPGIYFAKLIAGDYKDTKKITLIK